MSLLDPAVQTRLWSRAVIGHQRVRLRIALPGVIRERLTRDRMSRRLGLCDGELNCRRRRRSKEEHLDKMQKLLPNFATISLLDEYPLRFPGGRNGSQAVILPQIFRAAAMRCEAAPQLASRRPSQNGQEQPLCSATPLAVIVRVRFDFG
jgi:hypothetical protein